MDVGKLTIYQDDNIKIQIDRLYHEILSANRPQFFKLNKDDLEFVLKRVFFYLDLKDLNNNNFQIPKEKKIRQFIGNIPIIVSNRPFGLLPPYDSFNEILFYISINSTLDGIPNEIATDININFKDKGFYCHIFPHAIFDVKGFITYTTETNETILLFGFKDDIQNLDFLDMK